MDESSPDHESHAVSPLEVSRSVCIGRFAEGERKRVEVEGTLITIEFKCHEGRRARIVITAPPGAVFVDERR